MKTKTDFNDIFLMALSAPENARIGYFTNKQIQSGQNVEVFKKYMLDAFQNYRNKLETFDWRNMSADYDLKIPFTTSMGMSVKLGNIELQTLKDNIEEAFKL